MNEEMMKMILEKLEVLNAGIQEVKERLTRVENRLDRMEARLNRVETRLDRVETRLDQAKTHLDQVETRLGQVETRLEGVEKRLAFVEVQARTLSVIIENEVKRMINIVAEGHWVLHERLKDSCSFESERERMDLRILQLQMELKKLKEMAAGTA